MIPGSLGSDDMDFAAIGRWIKGLSKHFFAGWIIYQTVKGTLTTTFIWAPMIYYYFAK